MEVRTKKRRRWARIRLGIYVVSFGLLAALGLAALADALPNDSILIKAGVIFVVLIPALVALTQAYDWLRTRPM
jgi:hypothetical protein